MSRWPTTHRAVQGSSCRHSSSHSASVHSEATLALSSRLLFLPGRLWLGSLRDLWVFCPSPDAQEGRHHLLASSGGSSIRGVDDDDMLQGATCKQLRGCKGRVAEGFQRVLDVLGSVLAHLRLGAGQSCDPCACRQTGLLGRHGPSSRPPLPLSACPAAAWSSSAAAAAALQSGSLRLAPRLQEHA